MTENVMASVLERLRAAPHSASALTLYALASTLDHVGAGCLFKPTKLRDLDPDDRRLAYELMELMVCGDTRGEGWRAARATMDAVVRGG